MNLSETFTPQAFSKKLERVKGLIGSFITTAFPVRSLSGQEGADAKSYQEKQIKKAIENVKP